MISADASGVTLPRFGRLGRSDEPQTAANPFGGRLRPGSSVAERPPAQGAISDATHGGDSPDELRFGIRHSGRIVGWVYISVNLAVTLILVWAVLFAPNFSGGTAGRIIGLAVMVAVFAPMLIWSKRRMIDASVRATPEGVFIYNGVRTHFVAWSDVTGFEGSSRPYLMAVTRLNGRPIPMDGITHEIFGNPVPRDADMRELEAYWRRMTGTTV